MSGFACQECGRKFKTVKAAEKAANDGCPKCGGVDIDLDMGGDKRYALHTPWEPITDTLHPQGL